MNKRIYQIQDFDKIIEHLIDQAATSLGKERAKQLKPETELSRVKQLQDETDQASQVIRLYQDVPFGGITDIKASLKRVEIGGSLNAQECNQIADTIYGGKRLRMFIENIEEEEVESPSIRQFVAEIEQLNHLDQEIRHCIDENGHVMDSASPKLRSIRSKIRTNESRVRERLNSFTKSKSKMLSEAIVTIRNDRYVLPVKQRSEERRVGKEE